jgi:hypothetical protein
MTMGRLKQLIRDLPDNSPVVMFIQHEDRPQVMAQVSDAGRVDCEGAQDGRLRPGEPVAYLMLTAYEKDIIRDGKLKPTNTKASGIRAHWGPPQISSGGGGIVKK